MVMTLWHTAPVKTFDELKTADVVIGSFNKTHLGYQWSMLIKTTFGANYKVITGYPSGNHLNLAMERGEIHGWTASWENLVGTKSDWLREKKVTLLVQFALDRMPDLPGVPTLLELAPPDRKDVVEFVTAGTPFARALARRAGRAGRPGRGAARGLRRAHAGPGVPRRCRQAQARHHAAQCGGDPCAGGQDGRRLARVDGAGEEGDRAGLGPWHLRIV